MLPYLLCYHTLLSSAVVSNTELDSYLAGEYGIDQNNIPDKAVYAKKYEQWQLSHQPFHWFVEFYGIIKNGGFDVIIGNPPYVEYSKVRYIYSIQKNVLRTIDCGNLFAYATERAISLACEKGRVGLIVLLASFGTTRMYPLQQLCRENCDLIIASHYEATSHPSVIFVGVEAQLSIILSRKATLENAKRGHYYTTNYIRTYSIERPYLFERLSYSALKGDIWNQRMPRLCDAIENSILEKLQSKYQAFSGITEIQKDGLYFRSMGNFFWKLAFTQEPVFQINAIQQRSSTLSEIQVPKARFKVS